MATSFYIRDPATQQELEWPLPRPNVFRTKTMYVDHVGRSLLPVSEEDRIDLNLSPHHPWWWCILPPVNKRNEDYGMIPECNDEVYTVEGMYLGKVMDIGWPYVHRRAVGILALE